jgi:hypothetical protein
VSALPHSIVVPRDVSLEQPRRWARSMPAVALPTIGLAAWALGVGQMGPAQVNSYGLLAHASPWFLAGLAILLTGFLLELSRSGSRSWVLALHLVALIVAIHATVPIIYGAPEYAWVYKHIGIAAAMAKYGRLTDPTNIYDQWPALFAAVAAVTSLGHVSALSFATWTPLVFELADALLLVAIFRCLGAERRTIFLAVALYEGVVAWVGQDYLSPQAFAYLLWLAMAVIILRWLRSGPPAESHGLIARLRAPLVAGLPAPAPTTRAMRIVALAMVAAIYFVLVAAHQLTPYVVIAGILALTLLDVVRPRWLVIGLAAIAGGYLAPHLATITHNFGGLFSGGNPIANAAGARGTYHPGAEATTAKIVRMLAGAMWLLSLAAVWRSRRTLGRVVIPAALAFSPFVILGAQSYGGEAIYRVFLFSSPWCAFLIAGALGELRRPRGLRWALVATVSAAALGAGLQGLYGPAAVDAMNPAEVTSSQWLYQHVPHGSLIVLPVDDFPALQSADYNTFDLEVMPSDPQIGESWLNEGNIPRVKQWIADLGHQIAYIVFSRTMTASAAYYGAPLGYSQLLAGASRTLAASVAYRNADVTIYRLDLAATRRTSATAAPAPAAATPTRAAPARAHRRVTRSRRKATGRVRRRYRRSSPRSLSSPK